MSHKLCIFMRTLSVFKKLRNLDDLKNRIRDEIPEHTIDAVLEGFKNIVACCQIAFGSHFEHFLLLV